MSYLFLCCIVLSLYYDTVQPQYPRSSHDQRSSVDLGHMLYQTGSCNLSSYTKLAFGYGNHCGLGGSGSIVDDIDYCCYLHDACWGVMDFSGQVFEPYEWGYLGGAGGPLFIACDDCLPENMRAESSIKCVICKCDRSFSICLEHVIRAGTPCPSLFG